MLIKLRNILQRLGLPFSSSCDEICAVLLRSTETSATRELCERARGLTVEQWTAPLDLWLTCPKTHKHTVFRSTILGLAAVHAHTDNGNALFALLRVAPETVVTATDGRERTVLHMATLSRNTDVTRRLLQLQPSLLESRDCMRQTPLHHAILLGLDDMVRVMLNATRQMPLEWRRCLVQRIQSHGCLSVLSFAFHVSGERTYTLLLDYVELEQVQPAELRSFHAVKYVQKVFFDLGSIEAAQFLREHAPDRLRMLLVQHLNSADLPPRTLMTKEAPFIDTVLGACLSNLDDKENGILLKSLFKLFCEFTSGTYDMELLPLLVEAMVNLSPLMSTSALHKALRRTPFSARVELASDNRTCVMYRLLTIACQVVRSRSIRPKAASSDRWQHGLYPALMCIEYMLQLPFPWTHECMKQTVQQMFDALACCKDRSELTRRVAVKVATSCWLVPEHSEPHSIGQDAFRALCNVATDAHYLLVTGNLPNQGEGSVLVPDVARLVLEFCLSSAVLRHADLSAAFTES
ncbi:MAG: hypothetical protein MHM6MM_000351 [Cercozoa sp. M6MM]